MKTFTWDETTSCAEIIREAEHEDVVIFREGRAVALVTHFDDDDLQWYAREHDPEFLASIGRARQQIVENRTTNHQELKRSLGID